MGQHGSEVRLVTVTTSVNEKGRVVVGKKKTVVWDYGKPRY